MSGLLQPARREDLAWVWPAARAAELFDEVGQLEEFWAEAPWRVRVNTRGEAALLVRWRAHLDILAMRGLWCSERRVPLLLEDLRATGREQGFERLLSPLVPVDASGAYTAAAMQPIQEILVMRSVLAGRRRLLEARDATDVTLRTGSPSDLEAVASVDGAAFDDFWRYDDAMLTGYMAYERLALAVRGGEAVGYTLCTVRRNEGSLGRLAVRPEHQGRGIGALLLEDSLGYLERTGARCVTLCTQAENVRSRSLYRRAGFEEVPGRLLALLSGPL